MKTYRPYEPDQLLLIPPSLREWLPEDHLVYFISDIVDGLKLSAIEEVYEKEERGYPPYHPGMMTKVIFYAYCVGVYSSRRIARKLQEDVAFRIVGAGNFPDFRTISDFRKRHLEALKGLFVQVVEICRRAGLVQLGHISLDGTKIKANASKHKAMSYGRMKKETERLKQEIEDILRQAEEVDRAEDEEYGRDKRGDELPEELARRESRLKKIEEAMKALEEEARQNFQEEDAEDAGKKRGKKPAHIGVPKESAQRNFTDSESKIMINGDKAFIQGYNAQAAVDASSQVIVAADVSNKSVDKKHVKPMVEKIVEVMDALPEEVSADAGYFSGENVEWLREQKVEAFISPDKQKHNDKVEPAPRGRIPEDLSVIDRMRRKLRTKHGRGKYKLRKQTVEPVFGQIKEARGFRQFLMRGLEKVKGEWSLICTAHNILKLYRAGFTTCERF
ncbi:MAG: IS1182 family transposase [Candidatus Schekmanbacteria bacterium]|nr:IS1182 family transposase [Candidatus Schekmanbacteria bacterium]